MSESFSLVVVEHLRVRTTRPAGDYVNGMIEWDEE